MTNIREDLKRSFELATLRDHASKNLNGDDWHQYRKIEERHAQARKDVVQRFRADSPELVAKAKKRILNEEGRLTLTYKPKWAEGRDKFDKEKLHARAVARVKGWEQAELRHLDDLEHKQIKSLVENAQAREELRQRSLNDFNRAADRRSERDRRQR